MLNRVESKKRMIGPRRGSQTGDGASRDQSSPTRVTSKRNSTGSSAAALTPAPTTGGFSTPMRQASKGTGASSATPAGDAGALLGESQGTLWSRQNSKDGGPQRVSSKLRKLGFKNLEEYEDGELEREFVDRVQQGEDAWVLNCLAAVGRRILFSEWAGGIARTSILYASKQGDQEMCKILLAYGGKELLKVKDLKGRDGEYYAKLHGIDLLDLMHSSSRIDCWNHKALRQFGDNVSAAKKAHQKSPTEAKSPELLTKTLLFESY